MPTIDVDAHFEPGETWLQAYPDLMSRLQLPETDIAEYIVTFTVGDFIRRVPEAQRPTATELIPAGLIEAISQEKVGETARRGEFEGQTALGAADGRARIKWMDAQGIDYQNVICLGGVELAKQVPDAQLAREAVGACNEWLANTTEPYRDRLLPVTVLECSDLDWCVEELKRMRARGSRQFIIPSNPIGGVPAYHRDWDRIWSTATELGMVAMVHGGYDRAEFDPGWANTGDDMVLLRRMAHTQRHQCSEILCTGLILGGVFERHPNLTVIFAEVGVSWLSLVLREIDSRISPLSNIHTGGEWDYPLLPSEYMERNVRITPLASQPHESPAELGDDLSKMLIFSSDFPHIEGSDEPRAYFENAMQGTSSEAKESFYGGNINAAYARMGAPIF